MQQFQRRSIMKSKILLSIIAVLFTFSHAIAEEAPNKGPTATDTNDTEKHKQAVEEYKKFLNGVPPVVRDEIREYRKSVMKINKEKAGLYKKLSQEAQDFLSKEQQFKRKLPAKDTRTMAIDKN